MISSQILLITLNHYLFLSAFIFTLGVFGIFLNRKNVITILMSIELMLLAVNLNLEKEIGWWYRSTKTSYNSEESNNYEDLI